MLVRLAVWLERLRARLWVIPALAVLGAALVAWLLVAIDRQLATNGQSTPLFAGGPESARAILSTIAAAMLTFTGLVFSVTMLVLQLASSQLSPRVTRTFLRDRGNQLVLGIFVATFVYALLVLREVESDADGVFVPTLAIGFAFLLLLASVGAFIFYIDHMAHAMRVSTVIANVGDETRAAIDRCCPDGLDDVEPAALAPSASSPLPEMTATIENADRPGVVQAIDTDALEALARDAGTVLEVVVAVGDPVPGLGPLVIVRGGTDIDADAVRRAITVGPERTIEQDPSFGFRQLVDIALRALSPAVNDPTTATQAIDRLHDLLRRLAGRRLPPPDRTDPSGRVRLIVPTRTWDDYVDLACAEVNEAGRSLQVDAALRRMLADLEAVVPDERLPALRRQLDRIPGAGSPRGG